MRPLCGGDLEMLDGMEVDPMISAAPQFLPDFPWDNLSERGTKCFKDSSYGTSCVLCVMAVGTLSSRLDAFCQWSFLSQHVCVIFA